MLLEKINLTFRHNSYLGTIINCLAESSTLTTLHWQPKILAEKALIRLFVSRQSSNSNFTYCVGEYIIICIFGKLLLRSLQKKHELKKFYGR